MTKNTTKYNKIRKKNMITRSGINVKDLKSMPLPKIECLVTFDFEKNHDKK